MIRSRNMYKQNILLKQINQKRTDMYAKAAKYGFTDSTVVECSQELDTLLNQYQEVFPTGEVG